MELKRKDIVDFMTGILTPSEGYPGRSLEIWQ
jgi:hypothetical protein